ncbi:hypothetical protein J1614_007917 [Plenodomus biglobosus]|nr:hypothetical protein J1614_007917 [Plenodomus biglobosus]
MVVWRWFRGLQPKTRMILGAGIMAYAGAGLYLSDRVEEALRLTSNEKEQEELWNSLPKITVVEKKSQ